MGMTYIPENMIVKPDGYPVEISTPEIDKRFRRALKDKDNRRALCPWRVFGSYSSANAGSWFGFTLS